MSDEKMKAAAIATAAGAPEYARGNWVRKVFFGNCSQSTFDRLRRNKDAGFPRPVKFGKVPLFNIEEVRQWASSHRM